MLARWEEEVIFSKLDQRELRVLFCAVVGGLWGVVPVEEEFEFFSKEVKEFLLKFSTGMEARVRLTTRK